MRLVVVITGAFGFMTAVAGSLAWDKPLDVCLVNGIVSALIAGILFRWWMKLWISCLEQVSREAAFQEEAAQLESESQQSDSRRE